MKLLFQTLSITILFCYSCNSSDKLNLDKLPSKEMNFNDCPDTIKKIFFKHIGPKIIINNKDTIKIYPDDTYDFVFIDKCVVTTELISVSWPIKAWFDHYDLIVNQKKVMMTKHIDPPIIIYKNILYSSNLLNVIDSNEYLTSRIITVDLEGKINICPEK